MRSKIESELQRIGATDVAVTLDDQFEPRAGELVRVDLKGAYWHLFPERFLRLLQDLPDGAGSEAVRFAIEENATLVWHGPAPRSSRETPP